MALPSLAYFILNKILKFFRLTFLPILKILFVKLNFEGLIGGAFQIVRPEISHILFIYLF